MAETIYIVQGSTGEYSDHREWLLKAFRDEKQAQRLVVEAQARANEIHQLKESDFGKWYELNEEKDPAVLNEFDSAMDMDFADTNIHYTCYSIELV
jgi:hypothetical protein